MFTGIIETLGKIEKIEKDMSTLRKKYDELLKWTLQLTGERDQLQKLSNKLTQENTIIDFCFKNFSDDRKISIFKGDSDQDRPNLIP